MALGLGLGLSRSELLAFTPGRLSGLVPTLVVSVARANGLLFQDLAKTVPAALHNDPVMVAGCPYLRSLGAAADSVAPAVGQRPLLQTDGAHWWLLYDGADDKLVMPARVPGLAYTLAFAGRPASIAGSPAGIGPETNGFAEYRVNSTGKQMLFQSANAAGQTPGTAVVAAGADHVWQATYSGAALAYFLDGASDGGGAFNVLLSGQGPKMWGGWGDVNTEIWTGRYYGGVCTTGVQSAADLASVAAFLKGLYS